MLATMKPDIFFRHHFLQDVVHIQRPAAAASPIATDASGSDSDGVDFFQDIATRPEFEKLVYDAARRQSTHPTLPQADVQGVRGPSAESPGPPAIFVPPSLTEDKSEKMEGGGQHLANDANRGSRVSSRFVKRSITT